MYLQGVLSLDEVIEDVYISVRDNENNRSKTKEKQTKRRKEERGTQAIVKV